jgi:hypothetical protein
MAAANEQIGIVEAAFYPMLSLSAVAGFTGTSAVNWFTWPSRFFAVGPTLSQTLFDHGRRRAASDITLADYDSTVAFYRQTTLTAFQQVEDNLNALHGLEVKASQQHGATASITTIARPFQHTLRGRGGYILASTHLADGTPAKRAKRHRHNTAAFRGQRPSYQGAWRRVGHFAASKTTLS